MHEKNHIEKPPVKCEKCNLTFINKRSLIKRHRLFGCPKELHRKKEDYPSHVKIYENKEAECLICNHKYKSYGNLKFSHSKKGCPSTSQNART